MPVTLNIPSCWLSSPRIRSSPWPSFTQTSSLTLKLQSTGFFNELLEGMLGNTKALKRNDKESNGILVGPSMAPRFFRADQIPSWCVFRPLPQIQSRLRAKISRRGWQADDRTFFERRTSIRMTAARTIHNLDLPTTYGSGDP